MKLLKHGSRLWEPGGGNVKTQTALGDALFFWSSDRGSTPLGSTTSLTTISQDMVVFLWCEHCIWWQ